MQDGSDIPASLLPVNKSKNQLENGNDVENEDSISDADLENIVGVGDNSELEVLPLMKKITLLLKLTIMFRNYLRSVMM